VHAQSKLRGQPATLAETFPYLDKIFADDTTRYGFMTLPEFYLPLHYDMSLGLYMRNNWLAGNSKLKRWFISNGVNDPGHMSTIILTSFHRYLNHEPIDLGAQIKQLQNAEQTVAKRVDTMHYIYDFKEAPSQASLLKKFPVGETIMIYTAAEKQTRSTLESASLRAFAVVRAHKGEALLFEITHIEEQPDAKPMRTVGEIVEGYPSEVYRLPPPGWKWQ
jgi:hypothetical protein